MTELEKALQSPVHMDGYLETTLNSEIIRDIQEYANVKQDQERRKFAAMAMQGLCALQDKGSVETAEEGWRLLAEHSVMISDSLIEALNKQP